MRRLTKVNSIALSFIILAVTLATSCCCETDKSTPDSDKSSGLIDKAKPGEILVTNIYSPENGNIAVRIDVPEKARYKEGAPVVVAASTWFVDKYNWNYFNIF